MIVSQKHRLSLCVRRAVQTFSLGLFLWLLWRTAFPLLPTVVPVDSFLRLDPALALGLPLLTREWIPSLMPGLAVLALCLCMGRVFCGYMCPMGCTLDMVRCARGKGIRELRQSSSEYPAWYARGKYLVLAATLGAAALGVNLLFWDAPVQLITRFYVLVMDPVRLLLAQWGLAIGQPVWQSLDMPSLSHMQLVPRRYDTVLFTALLFAGIFALEWRVPRFWCRCLCPAGALMALCSPKALWRRRVHRCEGCGLCVRRCPTGAIAPNGIDTAHRECIGCQTCVSVCPVRGVSFGIHHAGVLFTAPARPGSFVSTLPCRRAFVMSTGVGLALGALHLTDLPSILDKNPEAKGLLQASVALRPPGALPEADFLARCVRCGQCMRACPTNGLQPAWIDHGLAGSFSPVLIPRRGPCEPGCAVCGQVCPARAITPLALEQKHWARMGTAVVVPGRCLAFAMDKRCMVCQEVCPYGALKLVQKPGQSVPVPVVLGQRCFGCGYCEHHCPVRVPAIIVEAFHALRLPAGMDYKAEATARGFVLDPNSAHAPHEYTLAPDELPPGFTQ